MKGAYEIAESFRAKLAALSAFAATDCRHEQTGEGSKFPRLLLSVESKPLDAAGRALEYTLTFGIESSADRTDPADADPGIAHGALVTTVHEALLGSGKAALLTGLQALAIFDFRGWSLIDSDPAIEDRHFRTPLTIHGIALVL